MIVRLTLVNQDPGADSRVLMDILTTAGFSENLTVIDYAHGPDEPGAWAWLETETDPGQLVRAIDALGPVLVEVVES